MYSRTFSDTAIADGDHRWFQGCSEKSLENHAAQRATLHLQSFPSTATVTVNARTFPPTMRTIRCLQPGGVHLVTVRTSETAPALAIFFRASSSTPVTIRYDAANNTLALFAAEQQTQAQKSPSSIKVGVPSMQEGTVGAFAAPAEHQWRVLTSAIDDFVLATAGIESEQVVVRKEVSQSPDVASPDFAPLPKLGTTHCMSASDLTALHLDRTAFVRSMIKRRYAGVEDRLIGELQFAYICFAYLGCLKGLDHWVHLLNEICNASELDEDHPGFVERIAKVLDMQFSMMDDEAVQLTFGKKKLKNCLARFISSSWQQPAVVELAKKLNEVMYNSTTNSDSAGSDSS